MTGPVKRLLHSPYAKLWIALHLHFLRFLRTGPNVFITCNSHKHEKSQLFIQPSETLGFTTRPTQSKRSKSFCPSTLLSQEPIAFLSCANQICSSFFFFLSSRYTPALTRKQWFYDILTFKQEQLSTMAPITNRNLPSADKMDLIFGIFGVLLAFLGVVVAIQTWRSHYRQSRNQPGQGTRFQTSTWLLYANITSGRVASYELSFILGRRNIWGCCASWIDGKEMESIWVWSMWVMGLVIALAIFCKAWR